MISANAFVPEGGSVYVSSGEMSAPSQVNFSGIKPLFSNAVVKRKAMPFFPSPIYRLSLLQRAPDQVGPTPSITL